MTSIKELSASGAFVPDELVQKTIKWRPSEKPEEESEASLFVRRLSIGMHEEIFKPAVLGASLESATARLISEATRFGENGEERLSYKQAFSLDPPLARAMVRAINEANGTLRKN